MIPDDSLFWQRVSTMPHVEAEAELRRRRTWAIEQKHASAEWGQSTGSWDLLITKLNEEIHILCEARSRANFKRAARDVLPLELYEAVLIRLALLDERAT